MRIVVALGGNALLRRGEAAEAAIQRAHVLEVASAVAALAAEEELVITHGNGPQVGLLALEADAYKAVAPYPLDILGAESQGMIGYLLVQALGGALPDREVVALLTQVLVDADDPAFMCPTKPIGPVYSETVARRLAVDRGWTVARDGKYFRRVVASPAPRGIVELQAIDRLVSAGSLVVCAGGGGIPVVADHEGLRGCRGRDRQGPDCGVAGRGARRRKADCSDGCAVRRARLGHGCGNADRGDDAGRASRALVCSRLNGPEDRGRVPLRGAHGGRSRHRLARRAWPNLARRSRHARSLPPSLSLFRSSPAETAAVCGWVNGLGGLPSYRDGPFGFEQRAER